MAKKPNLGGALKRKKRQSQDNTYSEPENEKRRFKRYDASALDFQVAEPRFFPSWVDVTPIDFSFKGIGFNYADKIFSIGEKIFVAVSMDDSVNGENYSVTKIPARIASIFWSKEARMYRFGIQFVYANTRRKDRIESDLKAIEEALDDNGF